jgi:hypothetical protein
MGLLELVDCPTSLVHITFESITVSKVKLESEDTLEPYDVNEGTVLVLVFNHDAAPALERLLSKLLIIE